MISRRLQLSLVALLLTWLPPSIRGEEDSLQESSKLDTSPGILQGFSVLRSEGKKDESRDQVLRLMLYYLAQMPSESNNVARIDRSVKRIGSEFLGKRSDAYSPGLEQPDTLDLGDEAIARRMGSEFLGKRMGSEFLGKRMGSEFLGKRMGSEFLGKRLLSFFGKGYKTASKFGNLGEMARNADTDSFKRGIGSEFLG